MSRGATSPQRDLARIHKWRSSLDVAFYDVGEALARLKTKPAIVALGCRSFAQVCREHVGVSVAQAERLVAIARAMSREEALGLGSTRAAGVVAIARALGRTGEIADLLARGIRVAGRDVDLQRASARDMADAVKLLRRGARPARGRRVSDPDRAAATTLEVALRRLRVSGVSVAIKAGPPGQEARLVVTAPVSQLASLREALATHW